MEELKIQLDRILQSRLINSLIVIIISVLIYRIISMIFIKSDKKNMLKNKKSKTYMKLFRSIIRYILITVTVLVILQINGVNVSSMLAGVGILSVIIGFAVQDVLKDIIKGIDIISDSYFHVGDIIKYNGIEGKVLVIGLKTTKIEDIRTFNIISIANRNIEQVEVVSNSIDIFVPLPYELKVEEAENVINEIINKIKTIDDVESCTYKGVNELAESSIKYFVNLRCKPSMKLPIRREALRCVLLGLDENNIQVPYNQIDIHQK